MNKHLFLLRIRSRTSFNSLGYDPGVSVSSIFKLPFRHLQDFKEAGIVSNILFYGAVVSVSR